MPSSATTRNGLLTRRELVWGAGLALGALWLPPRRARSHEGHDGYHPPQATLDALESSTFVYVSPLHPGGKESRCHGEVWYFADGGDAVLATGKDTWKARALRKGWDRARLWVGDFGPVSRAGERYRDAPSFEARAELDTDEAVFERLLAAFARKYPDEWDRWEPRFRKSYGDGSRILIRYRPVGA